MINKERLIKQLIIHEGIKLNPYECSSGRTTIGVGRNLSDVGISKEEAMTLLENDIASVAGQCYREFDWFAGLNEIRKEAIINLVFNLGLTKFKTFKQTIAFLERGKFALAGIELLDSRYAQQVGQRSVDVANMLSSGE